MSLGIVIKCPEGLVLATESRVSPVLQDVTTRVERLVYFNHAQKIFRLNSPHDYVGIIACGNLEIGEPPVLRISELIEELENESSPQRLKVAEYAENLRSLFMQRRRELIDANELVPESNEETHFLSAGFDEGEKYGRIYSMEVPRGEMVKEELPSSENNNKEDFDIVWKGQTEFVERIVNGYDSRIITREMGRVCFNHEKVETFKRNLNVTYLRPFRVTVMPLQDCVDLAIFLIETTITAQRLGIANKGCGGSIDVAVITSRDGLRFIQKKEITR